MSCKVMRKCPVNRDERRECVYLEPSGAARRPRAASERDGRVGAHSTSVDNRQPDFVQWKKGLSTNSEREMQPSEREREEDKGIVIIVVADTEPNTMMEGYTIRSF